MWKIKTVVLFLYMFFNQIGHIVISYLLLGLFLISYQLVTVIKNQSRDVITLTDRRYKMVTQNYFKNIWPPG